LKVFEKNPADQVNTTIHETFVPKAKTPPPPATAANWKQQEESWLAALKEKGFAGWPAENTPLELKPVFSRERKGVRLEAFDFTSQPCVRLRLYLARSTAARMPKRVVLNVQGDDGWAKWLATLQPGFASELSGEIQVAGQPKPDLDEAGFAELQRQLQADKALMVYIAPRGVGPTAWTTNAAKATQIRRRFMLLGQTLDSMRVWDIRRATQAMRALKFARAAELELQASGPMAVNALYASLFEPSFKRIELQQMPKSHEAGPDYLNVLKILDVPQALEMAARRCVVELR